MRTIFVQLSLFMGSPTTPLYGVLLGSPNNGNLGVKNLIEVIQGGNLGGGSIEGFKGLIGFRTRGFRENCAQSSSMSTSSAQASGNTSKNTWQDWPLNPNKL